MPNVTIAASRLCGKTREDDEDDDDPGQCEHQVGNAADHAIDPTTEVAGGEPERHAEQERHDESLDRTHKCHARPDEQTVENVAAECVGPQQVIPARPLAGREEVACVLVSHVGQRERGDDADGADDHQVGEAHECELAPEQAPHEARRRRGLRRARPTATSLVAGTTLMLFAPAG